MKKTILIFMVLAMLLNLAGCVQTVEVIRCGQCDEKNPADAKFCANCGTALSKKPDGGSQTPSHSHPTPNDSLDMENSGKNSIYFGNNVCVDGEVIYLGYYGNLYMFCGSEVAVYSGGGIKTTTMAEMYLYNGYVYYANLDNHCIYRINVADGSREIVVSDVGDIQDTFMRGQFLYVYTKDADSRFYLYSVNLQTKENAVLLQDAESATQRQIGQLDDDYMLFAEFSQTGMQLLLMNTENSTVSEGAYIDDDSYYRCKSDEVYIHLCFRAMNEDEEYEYSYRKVNRQTYTLEEGTEAEFNAARQEPLKEGLEWKYYLAWQNDLCREHKETGVQELLVKAGTGNREEGETVAKTYNIREIVYADDTRVIFKRYRMANGLEESVWQVDSDGNNLIELIRKEYYVEAPIPYPTGSPGSSGSSGSSSGSSGSDGPAVGTKTCALCEGDGRITCYYCKGSGKGPIIYVMGVPTEQGCTYCGSSGWRLCSGCGGHGVK